MVSTCGCSQANSTTECNIEELAQLLPSKESECAKGDADSCAWLGATAHGPPWCGPVPETNDITRAWKYWERSCRLGHDKACGYLALSTNVRPGDENGARTLTAACSDGFAYACYKKANLVETSSVMNASPNLSSQAQFRLATNEAFPVYRHACDLAVPEACYHVGLALLFGLVDSAEPEEGARLLMAECDRHRQRPQAFSTFSAACTAVAEAYDSGLGVTQDRQRARQLRQELCWLDGYACETLDLAAYLGPRLGWSARGVHALILVSVYVLSFLLKKQPVHPGWRSHVTAALAVVASALLAVQLWYFFTDGPYESHLWWLAGLAVVALPLWWLRQHLRRGIRLGRSESNLAS